MIEYFSCDGYAEDKALDKMSAEMKSDMRRA